MYKFQKDLLDKITSGGIKPGELSIITSGRQLGKSYWTNQAIDRLMRDINSRPIEKLVFGERRIHGSRFYTVEPIGGNWREMEQWAIDTFGESSSLWVNPEDMDKCRWFGNDRKFWFRNEEDRTMFVLKWV
jgi:hypothetical protein